MIDRFQGGKTMSDVKFCTCTNYECPIHPTKHDKGCTPCIAKNLKLGEVPNCFFNKIPGSENRIGDLFKDFAITVLDAENIE